MLAVDSALGACSVAILDDGKVLAHRLTVMERGHAEALAPMVEAAMHDANLAFASIVRLAVTTGPGTFTGQRVGLAFMRGLRVALDKPLIGVTSLSAMAHQAMAETGRTIGVTLHDARRNEVYLEIAGEEQSAPCVLPFEEAVERVAKVRRPFVLAGTAAKRAHEHFRDAALSQVLQPDALWVARLAQQMPPPDVAPKPLYLRPPDAKLPVRKLTPRLLSKAGDLAALAEIHASCFAEPWTERAIDELLATSGSFAFYSDNGFVLARVAAGEAEILTLAVLPDGRRRGMGASLVRAAANHARSLGADRLFLEVAVGNTAARGLYNSLGFGEVGRRKAYYAVGPDKREDALILRSNLPLPPLGKRPGAS